MKESEFWGAIAELDGYADEESVHELHELLLGEDEEDVAAFQEHLESRLSELRRRASEAGISLGEAEACAVVAAGREVYSAILNDPAGLNSREWDCEESILLRQAAPEVQAFLQGIPGVAEGGAWLNIGTGSDFSIPSAYDSSLERLESLIEASPEWRKWWKGADFPRLLIILELMNSPELRDPPQLRRRRDFVEFSMSMDPQGIRRLRLPGSGKRADEMVREHVQLCLEKVAAELSLTAIPPLP